MTPNSAVGKDDVFDRPLYLAGVLDNAADELDRTWFGYEWNDRTRCNCGIVARHVLQASPAELGKLLPPIYDQGTFRPSWREMTEAHCADSGLTRHEVFVRLYAAGLRTGDFHHLEDLSHPEIVRRSALGRRTTVALQRSKKSDVVAYLRTWATGIERFHDTISAQPAGGVAAPLTR